MPSIFCQRSRALHAGEAAVVDPVLGLIVQHQLVVAQGIAQLVVQGELALLLLCHGLAEEDVVALAGPFGHVDGGIGLLHQDQVILVIVAEQADPHGGAAVQLVIADVEGEPENAHQLAGEVLRQYLGGDIALAQRGEQQGELVPRGAGQH